MAQFTITIPNDKAAAVGAAMAHVYGCEPTVAGVKQAVIDHMIKPAIEAKARFDAATAAPGDTEVLT